EEENLRVPGHRPGKAEQLALADREVPAPVREDVVEPAREPLDEALQPDLGDRAGEGRLRGAGVERQVPTDVAREQKEVLLHEPESAPEILQPEIPDVDAVEQDPAPGRVVEP